MSSSSHDDWDANELFDRVFVGSQEAADDRAECERNRITHAVSIRDPDLLTHPITQDEWHTLHRVLHFLPPHAVSWIAHLTWYGRRRLPCHPGIVYRRFYRRDHVDEDLYSLFGAACRFVHAALEKNKTNRVLIHCRVGMSRSASVALAYAIYQHARLNARQPMPSIEQFVEAFQNKREIVSPNSGFLKQLVVWRRQMHATFID